MKAPMGRKDRKAGPGNGKPRPAGRLAIAVDEEVDLHGLTVAEAMVAVEMALARWARGDAAVLRIIHGQSSGDQGTIKGAFRRNLDSIWKSRILGHRPEPGNPGATLIRTGRPA
jgi:DNA-nicking Smr family endonuclease